MKKFGIYLMYPPTTDLRAEGLGRHLASFLKASVELGDVQFSIACPSWMGETLSQMLEESRLDSKHFEMISPPTQPAFISLFTWARTFTGRRLKEKTIKTFCAPKPLFEFIQSVLSTRSMIFALSMIFLLILIYPLILLSAIVLSLFNLLSYSKRRLQRSSRFSKYSDWKKQIISVFSVARIKNSRLVRESYYKLQESEADILKKMIKKRKDITAWYCPTLFWPYVTKLDKPVLICAPDVVLNDFPVGFTITSPHSKGQYLNVLETIRNGRYFTTYSEDVKARTLVERYHVEPKNIFVIHHGANRLDDLITCEREQSVKLLGEALKTARHGYYASRYFNPDEMKFIFYASQVRPNKNILNLLKSYEYLLRQRYLGFKLILTGNPSVMQEIVKFVEDCHLENDVIWLHGMTAKQLAACYHLAEISVNPTFSEGGFPFTFTESLSVGTPLVMSRIGVTEEIIKDPELNQMMLFDPYDWKDMADKIEWAIQNKTLLLNKQMPLYQELAARTWTHVVSDYVEALDKISSQGDVA